MAFSAPARAALGGDEASVGDDQARLKASCKIARRSLYSIHEITAPSGTLVREYVAENGRVFAVSWSGPFLPDLRQILGASYEQYRQAPKSAHARGRGVAIDQPGLVVRSSGRMRSFHGFAYLPAQLPQGVTPEEIR